MGRVTDRRRVVRIDRTQVAGNRAALRRNVYAGADRVT
jgi:hypothetical protein